MTKVAAALVLAGAFALVACTGQPLRCRGQLACSGGHAGTMAETPPRDAGVPPLSSGALVIKGAGCGKVPPLDQPSNDAPAMPGGLPGFRPFSVTLRGSTLGDTIRGQILERTFSVRVPRDYDPDRAYRTVYVAGRCPVATKVPYDLWDEGMGGTDEAIYVLVDPPLTQRSDPSNSSCFDIETGTASQEWEAFAAIHAVVDQAYCVDDNRLFVFG